MTTKPFGLSARIVIHDGNGLYLLLKRSKSSGWNSGKWELPGGKLEKGEGFEQALLREVKEETGLMISLERALGIAESELPSMHVVHLIMKGKAYTTGILLSSEHEEYSWIGYDDPITADLQEEFRAAIATCACQEKT